MNHPTDVFEKIFCLWCVAVCRLLESGVHAIFGPSDSHLASHIVSICESVSMPLLLTIADRITDLGRRHFVTDMFPTRGHLGQAFTDLINFLNWTKIAIVYDDEEGKPSLGTDIRHRTISRLHKAGRDYSLSLSLFHCDIPFVLFFIKNTVWLTTKVL